MVLALDRDDPTIYETDFPKSDKLILSIEDREDSLGAKYNRCQKAHEAELYVLGCDDTVISTKGWDEHLLNASRVHEDGIAVVYFGNIPGVFQPGIAVSHKLVEKMGYFMVPHFPFWWHDTWAHEIGVMIERIVKTDVDMIPIGEIKSSRGVREIQFWAKLFDDLRPERRRIAERIIAERLDRQTDQLERSNLCLRDFENAKRLESEFGFDAPENERYLRLKRAAETIGEYHGTSSKPAVI